MLLGEKRFRRTTWRQGTGEPLTAKFATRRVMVGHEDGSPPSEREEQWLLMEWRDGEAEPAHFHLVTLPKTVRRKQMVRLVKERYRTERVYEDMKGELGLDHFEGRRYPGWHHHVSVALSCYAFITAEKVRAFFPSAERQGETGPHQATAGTALRRLIHHPALGDHPRPQQMAAAVSGMSAIRADTSAQAHRLPLGLTQ